EVYRVERLIELGKVGDAHLEGRRRTGSYMLRVGREIDDKESEPDRPLRREVSDVVRPVHHLARYVVVRLNVRHINCECACGWERLRQVQFERRKGVTAVFQQDYSGDAARVICSDCKVQATSAPRAHAYLVVRRRLRIRR